MLNSWFYLQALDLCVCMPAKCGGTAFYLTAFKLGDIDTRHARSAVERLASQSGQGPYSPEEITEYYSDKPKLLGVRHPVERFRSLWRDKCRDGDVNMPMLNGWDPSTLIEHITQYPTGNGHWMPQYLYRVPGCKVVDCRRMLHTLGFENAVVNATNPSEGDPDMPTADILRHYSRDYDLWRMV